MTSPGDQFAAFADAVDKIVELINGFRSRMEAEGYSPTAAEMMAVEFAQMLMRSEKT